MKVYNAAIVTRPPAPETQARLKELPRILCWNPKCRKPIALGAFQPVPGVPLTIQCKQSNCGVVNEICAEAQRG